MPAFVRAVAALRRLVVAAVFFALAPVMGHAAAESSDARRDLVLAPTPRVALLMGNVDYKSNTRLGQVENDLTDMEQLLTQMGFRVTTLRNLGRDAMYRAASETLPKLLTQADGGTFFLYYSGHGMMIGDGNQQEGMLIPVDASIGPAYSVRAQTVPIAEFLRPLRGIGTDRKLLGLVVLDTCRSNPYVMGLGGMGVAEVGTHAPAPRGVLVASSTQPGSASWVGEGTRDSLYTGQLLRFLGRPGMTVHEALARTAEAVKAESRDGQTPWVEGDPSLGLVALRSVPTDPRDEEAWAAARRSGTSAGYGDYVNRYPQGGHFREAAAELARLAIVPPPKPSSAVEVAPPSVPVVSPPLSGEVGRVFRDRFLDGSGDGPEMVVLPSRTFQMGSTKETDGDGRDKDEGPQHEVRIGPGLAVGRYAVTVGEYGLFVKATGRKLEDGCGKWAVTDWKLDASANWTKPGFPQTERHPVVCVSWDDATAYAEWLSKRTGQGYRLLSEAEFEYSARGGTTTRRYWGDDVSHEKQCGYANGADQSYGKRFPQDGDINKKCSDGQAYTSPVGTFSPNDFKLYDMLGNVWQWTADCWHGNYTDAPADGSAWTSACAENRRVVRGGSWNGIPRDIRAAVRGRGAPDLRGSSVGFRVARTVTP